MPLEKVIPFPQLLSRLLDADQPLPARYFYRFSDLEGAELQQLSDVWAKIPLWRRQAILDDIETLSSKDMLLSFIGVASLAANDQDDTIRLQAVRSLWEYEERQLIPLYMKLVQQDSSTEVRASAAGALGRYVYAGEIEELSQQTLHKIENLLLQIIQGKEEPIVRRSALEALGYSSRDEVPALIEKAFASQEKAWLASALFAMGRSGNEKWKPQVLAMLEHPHNLVRVEAVRAAGELEISEAAPLLIELLDEPDDDMRLACIWSLSQVGGDGVLEILEKLAEELEDEESLELLEEAIENLNFNESMPIAPLLDISEDIDEEEDELDELELDDDVDLNGEEDED